MSFQADTGAICNVLRQEDVHRNKVALMFYNRVWSEASGLCELDPMNLASCRKY